MKRLIKGILFGAFICLCFFGCDNAVVDEGNLESVNFDNISYSSEASRVTGNLFALNIKTCEKAVNAVSAYVDEPTAARMAFGEVDFNDIEKLLPSDLSSLKEVCFKQGAYR